jgi:hypothetical protein
MELRPGEELVSPVDERLRELTTGDLEDGQTISGASSSIPIVRELVRRTINPRWLAWDWSGPDELTVTNRSRWALSVAIIEAADEEPSFCDLRLLVPGRPIRMKIRHDDFLLLIRSAGTPDRGGTKVRFTRRS